MIKQLLCLMILLFTATVKIPLGGVQVFKNIKRVDCFGNVGEPSAFYILKLENGKDVYVPVMFTIIEEQ